MVNPFMWVENVRGGSSQKKQRLLRTSKAAPNRGKQNQNQQPHRI